MVHPAGSWGSENHTYLLRHAMDDDGHDMKGIIHAIDDSMKGMVHAMAAAIVVHSMFFDSMFDLLTQ